MATLETNPKSKWLAGAKARAYADDEPSPLLVTRQQTAKLLACSVMTVQRLEWAGRLKPVRLLPGPTTKIYYRLRDVHRLAEGGDER